MPTFWFIMFPPKPSVSSPWGWTDADHSVLQGLRLWNTSPCSLHCTLTKPSLTHKPTFFLCSFPSRLPSVSFLWLIQPELQYETSVQLCRNEHAFWSNVLVLSVQLRPRKCPSGSAELHQHNGDVGKAAGRPRHQHREIFCHLPESAGEECSETTVPDRWWSRRGKLSVMVIYDDFLYHHLVWMCADALILATGSDYSQLDGQ